MANAVDLQPLVEALAEAVAERVAAMLEDREGRSPWMTTEEAVEYTRLPEGTFRELSAKGKLRPHGGRRKLYHRAELDEDLGHRPAGGTMLRRVDAA